MPRQHLGPGPGKYMLPPVVGYDHHDISRYRNPQYSMGLKVNLAQKYLGQGPKYQVEKMTRYGKASPPAYSIKSRQRPPNLFQTPGPGTYAPEMAPRMKEPRPPAYSMARRYANFRSYVTPGPDKYELPSTLGPKVPDKPASAAFTMTRRHFLSELERSPGPAKYNSTRTDLYRPKPPKYSISPRVYPPGNKGQTPGPIYLPKFLSCKKPDGYTFGLRTDVDPYITAEDEMPCIMRN